MDIRTSTWGPYSTQLPGISHIHDGHAFTVAVLPGTMSGDHPLVTFQEAGGNFEILDALPDLTYYRHLYHIGRAKRLRAVVEYHTLTPRSAAILVNYSNLAKAPVNIETFALFQSEPQPALPAIRCSNRSLLLDVADYSQIDATRATWGLDLRLGLYPCEHAHNGTTLYWGTVYKGRFVQWALPKGIKGRYRLHLRYRFTGDGSKVAIKGLSQGTKTLKIENTGGEYLFSKALGLSIDGEHELRLEYAGSMPPLELDCLVLVPEGDEPPAVSHGRVTNVIDGICVSPGLGVTTMRAHPPGTCYGLWSSNARKNTDSLGPRRSYYALPPGQTLQNAARIINIGNLLNGALNVAGVVGMGNQCRLLKGGESFEELMIVSTGEDERAVTNELTRQRPLARQAMAGILEKYRRHAEAFTGPDWVARFAKRLAAQTLTNINYPGVIGSKQQHKVRYYTPAKYYSTFYLWDMGMTGIGLSQIAPLQAEDLFRQYFATDDRTPFLSWGTMLPCHVMLYWNHYQVTRDKKFLADNFELAKRMYDFFAGHDPRSQMRDDQTGLLSNFTYSYNSGGWDDYPAQQRFHQIGSDRIFPVVCTAQTVLVAKMLRLAALVLGKQAEYKSLCADIEKFESLMYKYHWNEKEGLFSYYDARDRQNPHLTIDGEDANKGLDGFFPLASGSLKPDHVSMLTRAILDPQRFLTRFGLTTVDMTAGYYKPHGYWNGHIWIPPTWFFFRGLLNYGCISQARMIANRAIRAFAKASGQAGSIVECVDDHIGQPEHVPYFSGLTAPLLDIISSLYGSRPTTTGPDVDAELIGRDREWELKVTSPTHRGATGMILTLGSNGKYRLDTDDGKCLKLQADTYGKIYLRLTLTSPITRATIRRIR
ncbi:MAG: hypothetical protein GXY38_04580 [Planctomycetes bacterium]|nr:hypothetical protein [Planctomycetota bacterium]